MRRIAHVAQLMADAGVVALVPVISPYRAGRQFARDIHAAAELPFIEVWVSTPIEECEKRDPKGLYVKARAGELTGFTGIDDAYEAPESPELELPSHQLRSTNRSSVLAPCADRQRDRRLGRVRSRTSLRHVRSTTTVERRGRRSDAPARPSLERQRRCQCCVRDVRAFSHEGEFDGRPPEISNLPRKLLMFPRSPADKHLDSNFVMELQQSSSRRLA